MFSIDINQHSIIIVKSFKLSIYHDLIKIYIMLNIIRERVVQKDPD